MKKKNILKIKFIQNIKIKKIISKLIYIIAVIAILYNILFLIHTTITEKEYLEVCGISFLSMDSELMKEDINKNDLVITKEVNSQELQINDIIAYSVNGKIRINKITNIFNSEDDGKKYYTTKSNKNYYADIEKISEKQIIGKKIANIRWLGSITKILQLKITSVIIVVILCVAFYYNRHLYNAQRRRNLKKMQSKEQKNKP